jgi:hypothetical protein
MRNAYQQAMLFLTYIQGPLVNEWVKGVNAWLRGQVIRQRPHGAESIPTSPHRTTHLRSERRPHIFQSRRTPRIQQRTDQERRRVESSVQDEVRTLGTIGNVLQTHKFTQYLSRNDEFHLQGSHRKTRKEGNYHMNIHGRHCNCNKWNSARPY